MPASQLYQLVERYLSYWTNTDIVGVMGMFAADVR